MATYYAADEGLTIAQFLPSSCRWHHAGVLVTVTQGIDTQANLTRRPNCLAVAIDVNCDSPVEFELSIRVPWWAAGPMSINVNGQIEIAQGGPSSFHRIRRLWRNDTVRIEVPRALTVCPLPDRTDTVAFMDGPVVLAGQCADGRALTGDASDPSTILTPDNEREWGSWLAGYRTVKQDTETWFVPLYEIADEPYTVYFPVRGA
jgi:hypothetical protein